MIVPTGKYSQGKSRSPLSRKTSSDMVALPNETRLLVNFLCLWHLYRLLARAHVLNTVAVSSLTCTSHYHTEPRVFCREISKLDLCEGGSFSTAIFNSDIQLSVYSISCFTYICLSVCPFCKGDVCRKFALFCLSCRYFKKAFVFNLLCVLFCPKRNTRQ